MIRAPHRGRRTVTPGGIVPHLQNTRELAAFLKKVGGALRSGAHFVLSTFLPDPGYEPEPIVRDASVAAWSTVFTREELQDAASESGLDWVSTERAVEFEQSRTDPASWRREGVIPIAKGRPELPASLLRRWG